MELFIDIGNSRMKWALWDAAAFVRSGAVEHGGKEAGCEQLFEQVGVMPDRVCAANVAGEPFGARLAAAVRARWNLPVCFAAAQQRAGRVRNGYHDFRQLGVDRWLAIIAAADRFPGSVCVVDAGTALTVDLVADDGGHLGGYIVPGFDLMRTSLGAETGDLDRLGGGARPAGHLAPGRDTAEAIACGALVSATGLIDRSLALLAGHGKVPELVVTGGAAGPLLPLLGDRAHHRPLLVLEGLALYECDRPEG